MRIVIATIQVPFVLGGAETLATSLEAALIAAGHEADILSLPLASLPAESLHEQALAFRLLNLRSLQGKPVDRVIALKFPAYLISHPCKVVWLLHQHRPAYELWSRPELADLPHSPRGTQARAFVHAVDQRTLPAAHALHTISRTVSNRLQASTGLRAAVLYPPPPGSGVFHEARAEDFLYLPSRINPIKRQLLALRALAQTREPVRIRFSGSHENLGYFTRLKEEAEALGVSDRVRWLGRISDAEKVVCFARSLGVVFPPLDEDYGYVTLEAMLSSKPVITCRDSGGPVEFVRHQETGLVVEPTAVAVAAAMDQLWQHRQQAQTWGRAGLELYHALGISWERVLAELLR